jgi:hypothetical protein
MFSYTRYQSIVTKQITLFGGRHRIEICGAKSSRRSKSTKDSAPEEEEKKRRSRRKRN